MTRARTVSKFLRDASSSHVPPPAGNGCRRIGVPEMWHETHRAWSARFVVKMGCTFALKYSKSSDGDAGAGCCSNRAATGTKASIGITVSSSREFDDDVLNERSDCIPIPLLLKEGSLRRRRRRGWLRQNGGLS